MQEPRKRRPTRWFTPEEDQFILQNAGRMSWGKIAVILGRHDSTVCTRYKKLRAGIVNKRRQWTPEEDEAIRQGVQAGRSADEIARELGRTPIAVQCRLEHLGLSKCAVWSKEEVDVLRRYWGRRPASEIARMLSRTPSGVKWKAKNLGLPVQGERCPYFSSGELAAALGVSPSTVKYWARRKMIKAKKLYLGDRGEWYFNPDDVEAFAKTNPKRWYPQTHGLQLAAALMEKRFWREAISWGNDRPLSKRKRRVIPEELRPALIRFIVSVAESYAERLRAVHQEPEWLKGLIERGRKQRQYLRWESAEDQVLRKMFRQGATYKEIAERLGRTTLGVAYRIRDTDVLKEAV